MISYLITYVPGKRLRKTNVSIQFYLLQIFGPKTIQLHCLMVSVSHTNFIFYEINKVDTLAYSGSDPDINTILECLNSKIRFSYLRTVRKHQKKNVES